MTTVTSHTIPSSSKHCDFVDSELTLLVTAQPTRNDNNPTKRERGLIITMSLFGTTKYTLHAFVNADQGMQQLWQTSIC
eukprot:928758-Amphidinium_carterae.1